jgi:hypothetical protein
VAFLLLAPIQWRIPSDPIKGGRKGPDWIVRVLEATSILQFVIPMGERHANAGKLQLAAEGMV